MGNYSGLKFESGFIMLCDDSTEEECLNRNLFGDKAKKFQELQKIKLGDIGLLLNINKDELVGIFRACSKAQMHIEPDAWNGRFAAQVRIELVSKLQRIKDAAYVLKKTGVGIIQLKSGAFAPKFPVCEQDTMKKILAYFEEN